METISHNENKNGVYNLYKMLKAMNEWKLFLLLSFGGLAFELLNIQILGWGRKWVIDALTNNNSRMFVTGIIALILFSIISPGSIIYIDYQIFKKVLLAKYEMKRRFVKVFLKSQQGLNDKSISGGDLLYRVNNDINTVSDIYGSIYLCIACFGRTIGAFILSMILCWEISVLVILMGVIKLLIENFVIKRLSNILIEIKETEATFVDELHRMIKGSVFVRIFGNKSRFNRAFDSLSSNFNNSNTKEAKINVRIEVINWLLSIGTIVVIILVGNFYVHSGKITIGTLVVFLGIQGALVDPYRYFGMLIKQYSHSFTSYTRLQEVDSHNLEEIEVNVGGEELEKTDSLLQGFNFVVEKVSFSYDSKKTVLDQLSFTAKSGEISYIVGASGVGKTTLFKILLGLLKKQNGSIYLEDKTRQRFDLKPEWITYISQNNFIINATIKENICFTEQPDEAKCIEAAKTAGIYDYIMSLPEGFDTVITDNGKTMSGGQRSRICLARGFYRNSRIILLDEVFASLDSLTIQHILSSVNSKLDKNICILMITHRHEHIPKDAVVISI